MACTVAGPASGVYLFLWNRSDAAQAADVTISGDASFLELVAVKRPRPLELTSAC